MNPRELRETTLLALPNFFDQVQLYPTVQVCCFGYSSRRCFSKSFKKIASKEVSCCDRKLRASSRVAFKLRTSKLVTKKLGKAPGGSYVIGAFYVPVLRTSFKYLVMWGPAKALVVD